MGLRGVLCLQTIAYLDTGITLLHPNTVALNLTLSLGFQTDKGSQQQEIACTLGAGKTLISVMLIKYIFEKTEAGSATKAVFLVPKVDLAIQASPAPWSIA